MRSLFRRRQPPPEFEPLTVPWHREKAEFFRRNSRGYYPSLLLAAIVNMLWIDSWIAKPIALVYLGMVFVVGTRWQQNRVWQREHLEAAWRKETEATLNGLALSGIYDSPFEVLETMRDGPMPPGWKRKDWIEAHEEMVAHIKRQLEQADGD